MPSTGVELVPVIVLLARAAALVAPDVSTPVTSTAMVSPRSPLPGSARSSVRPVAPAMAVPLRYHWYV